MLAVLFCAAACCLNYMVVWCRVMLCDVLCDGFHCTSLAYTIYKRQVHIVYVYSNDIDGL